MPRYDYVCQSCEHIFELKQGFDAEPVATCPRCEGASRRKIYAPPVVFKGSGFYVNDYGKTSGFNGSSNGASESKKEESDSSPKSEGKTESKSESPAKTESAAPKATPKPAES